ncbi:MAG: MBL fold metallo-hydrolase [Oscillospiraceae bacterium]|nr:MBL fold metallo-hydrolase [Oscillospiraceae bacterium]
MPIRFCPLRSGSSGNVSFLGAGGTRLLIDAGHSCRTLEQLLGSIGESAANLDGIVVSHEHSDHIKGAGTLSQRYGVPIYANAATWNAMRDKPGFPGVEPRNQRVFVTGVDFYIGDVNVQPFLIPHDAAEPVGFAVEYRGRRIVTATDLGHLASAWTGQLEGADLVLIEANHDPDMLKACAYPSWLKRRILGSRGHLSNGDCAELLRGLTTAGLRHCVLGHMSAEANTPDLAMLAVKSALSPSVRVDMAYRDSTGGYYELSC